MNSDSRWAWSDWAENVVDRIKETNTSVKNLEEEIKSTIKEINNIKTQLTSITSSNKPQLLEKDINSLSEAIIKLSQTSNVDSTNILKNKESITEINGDVKVLMQKLSAVDINSENIASIRSDIRQLTQKISITQNEVEKFNKTFESFTEFKTKVKTIGTCSITTLSVIISIVAVIATATRG
jgi:chromosome segregation ATPase